MAGIGIELRTLAASNSFGGFLRAHLYAGILSSGAWIISISVLIAIYFYLELYLGHTLFSVQFLVAVTYLVSSSLILSGIFQHQINRFIADCIFENKHYLIFPNFLASALILMLMSIVVGYTAVTLLLANEPLIIKLLMGSSFVVLNIVWLFSNALAGLKNYRFVLFSFLFSYLLIFILAVNLFQYELIGLLSAFYIGHVVLLISFFLFMMNEYPAKRLFIWDMFPFMKSHPALTYSGFFFYIAIWIDKYCFWFNSDTSMPILGSLRSSPIYDMPIFIAFIIIIPGMAMFFYDMETDFTRYYHRYYDGIREGATLHELAKKHNELASRAKICLLNTLKVQGTIAALALLMAPEVLHLFGLAPIFVYLLRIIIIASSLLILLIAQLNLLDYLNLSRKTALISALFLVLNLLFTCLSFYLGPLYYGYGFAVSLLCCNAVAIIILMKSFKKLNYYSFMSPR